MQCHLNVTMFIADLTLEINETTIVLLIMMI